MSDKENPIIKNKKKMKITQEACHRALKIENNVHISSIREGYTVHEGRRGVHSI